MWAEQTFPEEICIRLWRIMSNNFFLVSSCWKANAITFFRLWPLKIPTQSWKTFLCSQSSFSSGSPTKSEKLLSKSLSINLAKLNLQKQWPIEIVVHSAVLKVREWSLQGHDVWDHLHSMPNTLQRISWLAHKRHTFQSEEVYITMSTEKYKHRKESIEGSRIKWTNKPTLQLYGSSDLLHSSGQKNPKCMYASATISVRQLTSKHLTFLHFPTWLSAWSTDQKRAFAYDSYYRLKISMLCSVFMNTNGCEQIPEIKKMLCRSYTAVISQEDPHWPRPPGIDTWDLLPGSWERTASTACLPGRQVGWKIHLSTGWVSQIPAVTSKKGGVLLHPTDVACFCVRGWGITYIFFSKPSIMSLSFLHLGINAKSQTS